MPGGIETLRRLRWLDWLALAVFAALAVTAAALLSPPEPVYERPVGPVGRYAVASLGGNEPRAIVIDTTSGDAWITCGFTGHDRWCPMPELPDSAYEAGRLERLHE